MNLEKARTKLTLSHLSCGEGNEKTEGMLQSTAAAKVVAQRIYR